MNKVKRIFGNKLDEEYDKKQELVWFLELYTEYKRDSKGNKLNYKYIEQEKKLKSNECELYSEKMKKR